MRGEHAEFRVQKMAGSKVLRLGPAPLEEDDIYAAGRFRATT